MKDWFSDMGQVKGSSLILSISYIENASSIFKNRSKSAKGAIMMR